MGTDINIFTEVYITDPADSSRKIWYNADVWYKNPYADRDGEPLYISEICSTTMNYSRFAVLANVRNYDNVQYISEPKGLPPDCCSEAREAAEGMGEYAYSHSWLTLRELEEFQAAHPELDDEILMPLIREMQYRIFRYDELDFLPDEKGFTGGGDSIRIVFFFDW